MISIFSIIWNIIIGIFSILWKFSNIFFPKRKFCAQIYIWAQKTKASLQPKKGFKIFNLKFVFLIMKKCISYNFHIWNLYDKLFFD